MEATHFEGSPLVGISGGQRLLWTQPQDRFRQEARKTALELEQLERRSCDTVYHYDYIQIKTAVRQVTYSIFIYYYSDL